LKKETLANAEKKQPELQSKVKKQLTAIAESNSAMEELEERMNVLRETLTKGTIDRDGFERLRKEAHDHCEKDQRRRENSKDTKTNNLSKEKIDITYKTETALTNTNVKHNQLEKSTDHSKEMVSYTLMFDDNRKATKSTPIVNIDNEKPVCEWNGMDLNQIKNVDTTNKPNGIEIVSPSREFFSDNINKNIIKNNDNSIGDFKSSRNLFDG